MVSYFTFICSAFLLTRPSRDVTFHSIVQPPCYLLFLLTRPSRDVTEEFLNGERHYNISTHTSLAGRDNEGNSAEESLKKFLLTRPSRDVTHSLFHP